MPGREARQRDDFALFSPHLENIVRLKQEQADAIQLGDCRYDSLMDEYEPFANTTEVEAVLDKLRGQLVPLIEAIQASACDVTDQYVRRHFDRDSQRILAREAATSIGFDFERGRIDVAPHPFCTTLGPDDIRITTRYLEDYFNSAFFGTLHEAGHGIYEQGLPREQFGLPAGTYCSLGIHESQSRLWENLVGRSMGFWEFFYPKVQSRFPDSLGDVTLETFFSSINQAKPSLIRVEADEATYNLHIVIRFELEKSLIEGDLSVSDLPDAWNQKYQEYLGIRPESNRQGVLQDVHWSAGLFGYFPTYTLGNLYASQLFDAAREELGDLDSQFANGEFAELRNWLEQKVYRHGSCFAASKLIKNATGSTIDPEKLVNHLRTKYGKIYQLAG